MGRPKDMLLLLACGIVGMCVLSQLAFAQQLHPAERAALEDIKSQLKDQPGSSFLSTWDFQLEPCSSFTGVVCTLIGPYSHVVMLNLGDGYAGSPGLVGTLSPSIGNLSVLQQLTLVAGGVRGRIPDSIGQLASLEFLGISQNELSGCIPESFGNLRSLQVLDLSTNLLSCRIPEGLSALPELVAVELSHNNLTGPVPAFRGPMTHLDLSWNSLSGALPQSMPASLTYLALKMNRLSGSINVLATLPSLMTLDLSSNDLSGGIPNILFSNKMVSLLLQRNRFSGGISVDMPVRISRLDLSYNNLSGEIPSMLAYAESLYLNNNHFTGWVPREFADGLLSANLRSLYLQHNFLTGFNLSPPDAALPASTLLCIQYNCLTPPSQSACPLNAGKVSSRPASQCTRG